MKTVSDGRVRYARNGDVHLAYRVMGDGGIPLVFVPGYISNVDLTMIQGSRLRPSSNSWHSKRG
jgi:hypothetical protein